METLRRCGHNGFPVMGRGPDGERIICGVVLRQQLLTLLATGGRSMQASPTPTDNTGKTALSYTWVPARFRTPVPAALCGLSG